MSLFGNLVKNDKVDKRKSILIDIHQNIHVSEHVTNIIHTPCVINIIRTTGIIYNLCITNIIITPQCVCLRLNIFIHFVGQYALLILSISICCYRNVCVMRFLCYCWNVRVRRLYWGSNFLCFTTHYFIGKSEL